MEQLQEQVQELKRSRQLILVEGIKDKRALRQLGIMNVVTIKSPLFELCEKIAKNHKEVIILTDLDKEGKRLYSKLKANLERNGVKVNDRFRRFLFKETELAQIEGIVSYMDNFINLEHV